VISRLAGEALCSIYGLRRRVASEETFLKRCLRRYSGSGQTLLEVGCGYCRFHSIVTSCGLSYIGVEKNAGILAENIARGIKCLSPQIGETVSSHVNVILFSHIIEHFGFEDLVDFLNRYLPKLRVGGVVIILTPVLHRGFYDDFDHVKPYSPAAIRQAFVDQHAQTQGFGILGQYVERDLWIKRDTLWHSFRDNRWMHFIKVPLSLLTVITGGQIGRLTGYGIVLEKIDE
jgi:hypothetical protein